jgi:hypothetical protein
METSVQSLEVYALTNLQKEPSRRSFERTERILGSFPRVSCTFKRAVKRVEEGVVERV